MLEMRRGIMLLCGNFRSTRRIERSAIAERPRRSDVPGITVCGVATRRETRLGSIGWR